MREYVEIDKLVKRKSSTNILSNTLERKSGHVSHGSQSLNNSVSAKMLVGSKVFQKIKNKESGDKLSINDLMMKKKSVDHIKKDNNIWKQMMSSKASDLKDKMIRF